MSKVNKCPYCGKRIPYVATYSSRRKAEYFCPRCEKESRVVINKKVILVFILCAVLSLGIMTAWLFLGLASNLLGLLLVAVPLIVFAFISPKFVRFEPLRKYKKSMEAKKAGIAYSDNLMISELDDESGVSDNSGQFHINSDLFNQIRAERSAAKPVDDGVNLTSSSKKIDVEDEPYVHVIDDVRENHSGVSAPLKKIYTNQNRDIRSRHYLEPDEKIQPEQGDDVREYKRTDSNKYSAQRRF